MSRGKGRGHGLVHSCPRTLRPERAGRDGLRVGPRERDGTEQAAAPVWVKEEAGDVDREGLGERQSEGRRG